MPMAVDSEDEGNASNTNGDASKIEDNDASSQESDKIEADGAESGNDEEPGNKELAARESENEDEGDFQKEHDNHLSGVHDSDNDDNHPVFEKDSEGEVNHSRREEAPSQKQGDSSGAEEENQGATEANASDKQSAIEEGLANESTAADQQKELSGPRKLRNELKAIIDEANPDVNRACSILDAMIEMQATITIPDIVLGDEESLGMIVRRLRKHENEELKKVAGILYEEFFARVKSEMSVLDAQKREAEEKNKMKKEKQKLAKQRRKNLDSLADQQKLRGQDRERVRADRESTKEGKEEKKKKRKRAAADNDDDKSSKKSKKRDKRDKEERKSGKGKANKKRKPSASPATSEPEEQEEEKDQREEQEQHHVGQRATGAVREWTEASVREEVWRIISDVDLTSITHRNVRERLANIFRPEEVEEHKDLLKEVTTQHIETMRQTTLCRRAEWSEEGLREEVERIVRGEEVLTQRRVRERLMEVFGEDVVEAHREDIKRVVGECTSP